MINTVLHGSLVLEPKIKFSTFTRMALTASSNNAEFDLNVMG